MLQTIDEIPVKERLHCRYSYRLAGHPAMGSGDLYHSLQYTGHYVADADYRIDRCWPGSVLLLFTAAGEGELLLDGHTYRLSAGTALLLDCGRPHLYHTLCAPWDFYYWHLGGSGAGTFAAHWQQSGSPVTALSPQTAADLPGLFGDICTQAQAAAPDGQRTLSVTLYSLLLRITEERQYTAVDERAAVERAAAYLRAHFAEPISVAQLAADAFLSRPYFSVIFKRCCGCAPHEYLIRLRVAEARRLLTETSLSVGAIAERTGFSDACALARTFQKEVGVAPTQFRKWFSQK